jgi:hypothetical protein
MIHSAANELGLDGGQGPAKRARLESIAVRQQKSDTGHEPGPNSRQSWSAGSLPVKVKGGRGSFHSRGNAANH